MRWLGHQLAWLGLIALLAIGQAQAHATLIEAVPADGSIVASAPAEVRLRFNEPVSPVVVHFVDARGSRRSDVHVVAHDAIIAIRLPADLPDGTQVVSYRVISSDGHPVGGSLVFSIGRATAANLAPEPEVDWKLAPILWLARLALYLGLFAGAGGAFFAAWIAPGDMPARAGRAIALAIGLGLLAAILSVGLQGLDALGRPMSAIFTGAPWREGAQTSFGATAATTVVALLCAWAAMRNRRFNRALSVLALGGAGLALSLSGHASAAEPQWLTRPAVFIHGTAAAFWVGALLPLALVVAAKRGASLPIVHRFSALAVPTVGAMALAGVVLGLVQIRSPSALLTTSYGQVFLAKMAGVCLLLGLATLNRQRLTPALAKSDGSRNLVRSIVGEIGLAVVILGLVATWRFTPPPRALMAAAAEPVSIHIHTAPAMVEVTLRPGHVGQVRATLVLMTGDFGPLDPKEVSLAIANPEAGIEDIQTTSRPRRRRNVASRR